MKLTFERKIRTLVRQLTAKHYELGGLDDQAIEVRSPAEAKGFFL
jgi:hypothetical protein